MAVLGVVLAGGQSSRMGQDKALLMRDTESMLDFSRRCLRDAGCEQVVVSGTVHGIADMVNDFGPIAGIASIGLHPIADTYDALLILPVDLPLITASLITDLRYHGEQNSRPCYFDQHYLPCYLPLTNDTTNWLKNSIESARGRGQNSPCDGKSGPRIRDLFAAINAQAIPCPHPELLTNANTPSQWQQVQPLLAGR